MPVRRPRRKSIEGEGPHEGYLLLITGVPNSRVVWGFWLVMVVVVTWWVIAT